MQLTHLLAALSTYFGDAEIHSTELKGGFSPAQNYLIVAKGKKYVLRVFNGSSLAELSVAIAAGYRGISPPVFWVAEDKSAYLMKYVEDGHFSIRFSKVEKNIRTIARSFQKIHTLAKEGIPHRSIFEQILEKYQKLKSCKLTTPSSDKALEELTTLYRNLTLNERAFVVIHGDLTPRNEFFDGEKLIIIDWDEVNLENLYYDLSQFSLLHNYSKAEEQILLSEYFGKPFSLFWEEYSLFKKINLFKCLTECVFFAYHLDPEKKFTLRPTAHSWSSCVERFEDPEDPLSSQFFYDWGLAALDYFFKV